jgi:hypothetical protein
MRIKAKCASCSAEGLVGDVTSSFEARGKYNGYPAVMCRSCGAGQFVSNAGRALLTRRAKTVLIPLESWKRMMEQWSRMFPVD